jgi:hypothetical protein
MSNVTKIEKTIVIFVDHTKFLKTLRVNLISPTNMARSAASGGVEDSGSVATFGAQPSKASASSALHVVADNGQEFVP